MVDKGTTFQQTYKWMEENGWERIRADKYACEKKNKKHQTARIGLHGFFKLGKSDEEIVKEKHDG